jgi:membrane fusion protein, heavy metal efflux system
MKARMKVSLVLVLLAVAGTSARAEDKEHHDDHGHAATPKAATGNGERGGDHDHDHEQPAANTQAKDDHGEHDDHDDHGHGDERAHVDEVKLTAEAIRIAKIRVEPVKKHALSATFAAPARVAFNAEAMAHVGSLVAGRVVDIKARVGHSVNKGDELLVVESMELGQAQSDYLQQRTNLAVASGAVEPAKQALERAKKLYDQNQGIALAEVQRREAELKAAEGGALTAKAGAAAALNRLLLLGMTKEDVKRLEDDGLLDPKLSVRAPMSGRVVEREVTLGELVSPEKERLIVIANTNTIWVLAEVSEARLPLVALGSIAQVQSAAVPDLRFEGKVTQIAPALNPDTRAARVRIEVQNPDGTLRPGMFAHVTLTSAAEPGAGVVAVPDEALQTVEGEPSVFVPVEGEQNTFAKRAVKVAKPVGTMVPILSGLKEGEAVVVSGTFILKAELGKGEASHEH